MRISDWSSDVCSSDLPGDRLRQQAVRHRHRRDQPEMTGGFPDALHEAADVIEAHIGPLYFIEEAVGFRRRLQPALRPREERSEEHTSELQSLMRISSAVFCLKKHKEEHHA